jgi:two-component system response regulator DesR
MRPIRVMIIDDCAVARHMVKLLLDDQRDLEVIAEAASFEEARALLVGSGIDVIILDLNLPDAAGLCLVERFRPIVGGIVVVSGNAEQHADALKLGAVACLEKSRIVNEKARLVRSIHEAGRLDRPANHLPI